MEVEKGKGKVAIRGAAKNSTDREVKLQIMRNNGAKVAKWGKVGDNAGKEISPRC